MNDSTRQDENQSSPEGYCQATGYVYDTDSDAPLIAQLHPEILILIFERGHEGWDGALSSSHTISSVCHYWRILSIGTPSLWSPIRLTVDERPDYLNRVRLYLKRSISGGLDKRLTYDDDFITRHLSHCRLFSLTTDDTHSLYLGIKRWGSAETPLLESLQIFNSYSEIGENPWVPPPPQVLFSSPNLHTVHMDTVGLDRIDATQYFKLVNITHFTFMWQCQIGGDRWLPGDAVAKTFISKIVEGMPTPHQLHLKYYAPPPSSTLIFPLLNSLSPSLTSFQLATIFIAWELRYGDLCHCTPSRLEGLGLSFHPASDPLYADVFVILGITPNLKKLYINRVDLLQIPRHRQVIQLVCLARMESIRLKWARKRTIEAFFQTLTAPALDDATFIADPDSPSEFDSGNPKITADIPEFWRSCTQVQSITLRHCNISKNIDLLATLCDIFRNVRNLDLGGNLEWDDKLLRGLGTSPWLCPHLKKVSFAYIPDLTQDALESFLRARKSVSLTGKCAALRKMVKHVRHPWI